MWSVSNLTPYAVGRAWARDSNAAEVWLVGVKATFDILPDGRLESAAEQVPVHLAPDYRGDPATTSLSYDADLLLAKPGTDVLLEGSAHSFEGPVTTLDVGFRVGPVARRARVHGDRHWEHSALGGRLTPPAPFTTMPLVWERAFGGTVRDGQDPSRLRYEPRNPVGRGFAVQPNDVLGRLAHNIEAPDSPITVVGARAEPCGFGPVAHHWSPRSSFAGTYDEDWRVSRLPLRPLDYDERYQHSAPAAQQVPGGLEGGEEVVLINLGVCAPRLSFRLPRMTIEFRTVFSDGSETRHRGALKTVVLDVDAPRVMLLWVSELPCHFKVQKLLKTIVTERPRFVVRAGLAPDLPHDGSAA
jgi:hypothetical protein